MKEDIIFGMDIAKKIFHVCQLSASGEVLISKVLKREAVLMFFKKHKCITIAMEACGGAHYWARELTKMGHKVLLVPAQYVAPFVKTNKNDKADAEAIAEAAGRKNMRFVSFKSVEQQDVQALHRIRERTVIDRTATINEIEGLLLEYGIIKPKGKTALGLLREIVNHVEYKEELTEFMREKVLKPLLEKLEYLCEFGKKFDEELMLIAHNQDVCKRLMKIPGIGPVNATSIFASVGNVSQFKSGREFAAYIGLVPRQHSSGGKAVLKGISKRGNTYLRKNLVHGARSIVMHTSLQHNKFKKKLEECTSLQKWILGLLSRKAYNKVVVATAARISRAVYKVMCGEEYAPELLCYKQRNNCLGRESLAA